MAALISTKNLIPILLVLFLRICCIYGGQAELINAGEDAKVLHIVYLGGNSGPTKAASHLANHHRILSSVLGSVENAKENILYSYSKSFNGFAATMSANHASTLSGHPEVVSVFKSKSYKPQTTSSWKFLGLNPTEGIWPAAEFGKDVIVGVMDTGISPQLESFRDDGSLDPIPSSWNGDCEGAGADFGLNFCNRKLIGAKFYSKAALANEGYIPSAPYFFATVRDFEGHGTHTASTAAGNAVPYASLNGLGQGTAYGGASKARLAVYKVCFGGCLDADILAAFDDAISDGVDILSLSFGDSSNTKEYIQDAISIASFHAMEKGITVVCATGNDGPGPAGSASNIAPWVITVGATTTNRQFLSKLTLGNNQSYEGSVLNFRSLKEPSKFYPLATAADIQIPGSHEQPSCSFNTSIDAELTKDKIVFCSGYTGSDDQTILSLGGAGLILEGDIEARTRVDGADSFVMPTTVIPPDMYQEVQAYITNTKNPTANIAKSDTVFGLGPAPLAADFTSLGPNTVTPEIMKPDIAAPGVDILAAWSPIAPIEDGEGDDPHLFNFEWNIISGTSMACPHVTGVAALLKALHPDWSPAAIKSAMMTTAIPLDEKYPENAQGVLAAGAGQINPTQAADPGLIYDISVNDYVQVLCTKYNSSAVENLVGLANVCSPTPTSILDFNYPALSISNFEMALNLSSTWNITSSYLRRTVTNVGEPHSVYTVSVAAPSGVEVVVEPSTLSFSHMDEKQTFTVEIRPVNVTMLADDVFLFGSITWTDGKHNVRSVISIGHAGPQLPE